MIDSEYGTSAAATLQSESGDGRVSGVVGCSESRRSPVECVVCGRRKAPVGRSLPLEMCGSLCDFDCRGYSLPPLPGHLWPHEPLLRSEDSRGDS